MAALLAGCAPTLPSWETVRDESHAAMQEVVDELPPSSFVEDLSTGTPFACAGDGAIYTGHLAVYPEGAFDGEDFIESLPAALADDWTVDEHVIPISKPNVSLLSGEMSLDVTIVEVDGEAAVDILAISRCGQMPPSGTP